MQAALAYPLLMAVIGSGVLLFLITFVVPKVTRMLSDLGQGLPLPTRLLIAGSDFLNGWWWLLLILAAAAATALHRYVNTEKGRLEFDRLALRLPLFGRLNLLMATARLTRTLGTLLQSGVPLLNALAIVVNLLSNRVLRQAIEDTAAAVREGEGLAAPLKRAGVFPPMVAQMAAVGERSGELEAMLLRVADAYEHQAELRIAGTSLAAGTADDPPHGRCGRLHRPGHPAADFPGQPRDGINEFNRRGGPPWPPKSGHAKGRAPTLQRSLLQMSKSIYQKQPGLHPD